MQNNNFVNKLNKNNHLIVFNNGIYDTQLYSLEMVIPNDYMTMTLGYDYVDNIRKNIMN